MAEPSPYRVGPPPAPVMSPGAAVGGVLVFVGLWLLFMGISEYYGGSSTQSMYRGTVLEHNTDINRIMTNAMSAGMTKIGFGIVALLLGGVIAAAGKKSSGTPVMSVQSAGQIDLNRKLNARQVLLILAGLLAAGGGILYVLLSLGLVT